MLTAVETLKIPRELVEVEIAMGEGILKSRLSRSKTHRTAIIADAAVASTYGKLVIELTGGELFPYVGGEEAKTRQSKQKFEDELLRSKFGRDTLLIGLGGGVVTDFTAFLASTYMRGVSLMLIPTTLLGMVDAAIGGKCGVDTPFGKNLIGAIYHPSHIFIDPSLLSSLPEVEWTHGLAEILKYGLIADLSIWELLEENPRDWKNSLSSLILASIRVKKNVVEQDPLETIGLRRILNFGHTIAHALETLSQYKMPHGEAVAIGCLAESVLSHRLGHLSKNDLARIKTLFRKFPFSFKLPPEFSVKPMLEAMQIDKKAKGGKPRFVLIDRIGHAVPFDGKYCRTVPGEELETLVQEALEL
jgi:3-dehydroquinate synthase